MQGADPNIELAKDMASFYADPLGFVMYAYPWDTDSTIQLVKLEEPWRSRYACEWGPDRWACEFLDELGAKIRERGFDPSNPSAVAPIREAIASGHGIGKSALVAWLVNFIMSTRPYAQGTVTANTDAQLNTKTWAQIAKWTKKCITGRWFEITTGKGAMKMAHTQHPESWFCAAQTCREENSEAFAGQHAANSTSFYVFDEGSAIVDIINEVSEGGMTDGEPMKFAFGNPTRNTGWFYECFHRFRNRWGTRQIDSRSVQITNKKEIDNWIKDYGIDSDFVKVRVRGIFPSMSAKQFISIADLDAAYGRHLAITQYNFAPKIITCDPAWEGDDELVIGLRQGLRFELLRVLAKNDNDVYVANLLAQLEDEHEADAVIVDAGYGTGIVSAGKTMGRDWHLVWFSGKSPDPGCLNMRAYMYRALRDWLKSGGSMQADPQLYNELKALETIPRLDGKIVLEAKKDIKKRLGFSTGRADVLAISFALNIAKRRRDAMPGRARKRGQRGHDPYAQTGKR